MNPLASISKNLREMESAYGKIKTPETREKARVSIEYAMRGLGYLAIMQAVPEAVQACVTITGVLGQSETETRSGVVSVGSVTVQEPFEDQGEPSCGVVGDLAGSTGEFETVVGPVGGCGFIGGWPERAIISIIGLAPNRRMLKGRLGDERIVSVERGMRSWKAGEKVVSRLVRAGASPLYRTM